MDERSWGRVEDALGQQRRLVIITGPGHGRSSDPGRRYDLDDCASAAGAVLDALEADPALAVRGPVDWVGNAWGGHVGIVFAARWPDRCRTLATFGTPVQGLAPLERVKNTALVAAFRLIGPAPFLRRSVVEVLLSQRTRRRDAEAVALIEDQLCAADRKRLVNAMISIMLRRRDLATRLPAISAPTLFVTGSAHATWTLQRAETASRLLQHGQVAAVADAAYRSLRKIRPPPSGCSPRCGRLERPEATLPSAFCFRAISEPSGPRSPSASSRLGRFFQEACPEWDLSDPRPWVRPRSSPGRAGCYQRWFGHRGKSMN